MQVRDVGVNELEGLRDRVRIVDVRERDEFDGELGHLEGAELVPLAEIAREAQAWDRAAPLLLVCRSGRRSMNAALQLVALGFGEVMNLEGGMLAYRDLQRGAP